MHELYLHMLTTARPIVYLITWSGRQQHTTIKDAGHCPAQASGSVYTAKNDFGYRSLNNSTFCKCLSKSENKKHRELSFSKTGYFIPVLDN